MLYNTFFLKLKKPSVLLVLACLLFYFSFAYNLVRTDYIKLITLYVALFVLFYKLIQFNRSNLKFLTYIAFLFRAIFILAIPNLSQDFYRFIWDGRMILEGFNPYIYTPESFLTNQQLPVAQAEALYKGMGALNASHFTNYPPINQLCFILAGIFAGKSIVGSAIVLRLIIIAADFGTLHFGKKLLEKLKLPTHNIFWYILNPFIIIELTGNLHFEGVMIFFLVWSLYLLHIGKWKQAAVVFAASVSVKLIPLLFLPLFFKWFRKENSMESATTQAVSSKETLKTNLDTKRTSVFTGITKLLSFYTIIGLVTLLLFLPFYSSAFVNNYAQTVALWFQNFEFNASIYYIAREIGYWLTGYNEIAIIGKILPIIVFLFVLYMALFKKNSSTPQLIQSMLFTFAFYLFMSTTIHPWYVSTLLILSVFTNYKFPLVWSFAIILSYLAYIQIGKADKSENLYIIALEYIIIFSVFLYELKKRKPVEN